MGTSVYELVDGYKKGVYDLKTPWEWTQLLGSFKIVINQYCVHAKHENNSGASLDDGTTTTSKPFFIK